jgi:hypothetical protein
MTQEELRDQDRRLRLEADAFLARHNILAILGEYGRFHLSGSHRLCLMTWRDLDFYVELEPLQRDLFIELGQRLERALKPRRWAFTDHLNFPSPEPVTGLYWRIQTDEPARGGWKLDIWGVTKAEYSARLAYCDNLLGRLNPQARHIILTIKNEVCRHPRYRDTIRSEHIYDAVLRDGATSVAHFWTLLGKYGIEA